MKINKKEGSLLLSLVFALFLVGFVSATVTLVSPASGSYNNGATVLVNVTNSSEFDHPENCTLWGNSTSTANSSTVALVTVTNSTAGALFVNGTTFDTTIIEDASTWDVFASCWNLSLDVLSYQQNTTKTRIIIDNTVPTTPSSLSPSAGTTDADGTINFSATVVGSETTACSLYFPKKNPGTYSYAMSHGANVCYYNLASIPQETYDYIIGATDGYNETNGTQTEMRVLLPQTSGYLFTQDQQIIQKEDGTLTITSGNELFGIPVWVVIVVVIAIVGLVIYFRRK